MQLEEDLFELNLGSRELHELGWPNLSTDLGRSLLLFLSTSFLPSSPSSPCGTPIIHTFSFYDIPKITLAFFCHSLFFCDWIISKFLPYISNILSSDWSILLLMVLFHSLYSSASEFVYYDFFVFVKLFILFLYCFYWFCSIILLFPLSFLEIAIWNSFLC